MKKSTACKNCGYIMPSSNFEICEECRKNHNLSKFLKKLIYFLGERVSFEDNDFEKMGIDEFDGVEYIWDLSKLNLIDFHDDKFFINKVLIDEFIEKHYISQYDDFDKPPVAKRDDDSDESPVTKICDEDYRIYDSSKVKIANNPHYRRDIRDLVENIEFIEESSKIPFPQSDDLNRFIFIGRCLLKKDKSKEDIKESNQIGNRIVNFYISTGFYFHLFEKYKKDKTIYYKLSDKGRHIFELEEYQLNLNICKCILEHEILYKIFMDCISNNSISKNNIINIMLKYDLNLNSMVTIERRAGCISSWMHWIFNLINDENTIQSKLY